MVKKKQNVVAMAVPTRSYYWGALFFSMLAMCVSQKSFGGNGDISSECKKTCSAYGGKKQKTLPAGSNCLGETNANSSSFGFTREVNGVRYCDCKVTCLSSGTSSTGGSECIAVDKLTLAPDAKFCVVPDNSKTEADGAKSNKPTPSKPESDGAPRTAAASTSAPIVPGVPAIPVVVGSGPDSNDGKNSFHNDAAQSNKANNNGELMGEANKIRLNAKNEADSDRNEAKTFNKSAADLERRAKEAQAKASDLEIKARDEENSNITVDVTSKDFKSPAKLREEAQSKRDEAQTLSDQAITLRSQAVAKQTAAKEKEKTGIDNATNFLDKAEGRSPEAIAASKAASASQAEGESDHSADSKGTGKGKTASAGDGSLSDQFRSQYAGGGNKSGKGSDDDDDKPTKKGSSKKASFAVNDSCSATLQAIIADRASKAHPEASGDPHALAEWLNTTPEGQHLASEVEDKYSCDGSSNTLQTLTTTSQLTTVVNGAAAGGFAGAATNNVQTAATTAAASGNPNGGVEVHRAALRELAIAEERTAATSTITGLGQVAIGVVGSAISAKQDNAANAAQTALGHSDSGYQANSLDAQNHPTGEKEALSAAGLGQALTSSKDMDADGANAVGSKEARAGIKAHKDLGSRASGQALQSYIQSAQSFATAAALALHAAALRDQANALEDVSSAQAPNPLFATTPTTGVVDTPPPQIVTGGIVSDSNPIVAGDSLKPDAGGPPISAPGFSNGPTSGGLAGPAVAPSNGFVGTPTASGAGGGSAGGGSGGGSGSGNDPLAKGSDAITSGGTSGFTGTSGGIGSFASSGSGKKDGSTGFDMAGLLGKLFPTPEELAKKNEGIDQKGKRGLASAGDDGSILGKNANLFTRISDTTMRTYKEGRIR